MVEKGANSLIRIAGGWRVWVTCPDERNNSCFFLSEASRATYLRKYAMKLPKRPSLVVRKCHELS